MTPRRCFMTDAAPKPRRRAPLDWWRVYDRACELFIAAYLAQWLWRGLFI